MCEIYETFFDNGFDSNMNLLATAGQSDPAQKSNGRSDISPAGRSIELRRLVRQQPGHLFD